MTLADYEMSERRTSKWHG